MIQGLKRIGIAVAVLAVLGAGAYFGLRWYDRTREVQVTDDAYVRGQVTDIASRVSGFAVEVLVDDNFSVKATEVIARIDPQDYRMNVSSAQAALDEAKAQLGQVASKRSLQQSSIAVAEAALRSAEAQAKNADITLARATQLLHSTAGMQAAVDSATAAAATATAGVDQGQANLAYENEQLMVIDADQTVAQAKVDVAQAKLLAAKFALDDTEIWAPIDVTIANLKTRVGEYVTAGSNMMSIVPTSDLWIDANYRETQIEYLKPGDPGRISIDTYPDKTFCGYVESVAPASGTEFALLPPDNATGNFTKIVRRFTVRIRFNARDENAALARPGMSVETAVAVSMPNAGTPAERGRRVGCAFDPATDIVKPKLTTLPAHPGLGRARPQGAAGVEAPK